MIQDKEVDTLRVADALYSCRAFLETLALSEAVKNGDREITQSFLMRKVTTAIIELGVDPDLLELPKVESLKEKYVRKEKE